MATTAIQVRLPEWAESFVTRRAMDRNTTKTAVIVEAIGRLQATDAEELMREGYQEMATYLEQQAEAGLTADNETLPTW